MLVYHEHVHVSIMKHVAKWIGRWTQDQKVWGSVPTARHV